MEVEAPLLPVPKSRSAEEEASVKEGCIQRPQMSTYQQRRRITGENWMIEVKKILFPTDFSDASHRSLLHGLELCRRFDAELTILHVQMPFASDPLEEEQGFYDEEKHMAFVSERLSSTASGIGGPERIQLALRRNLSAASGILEFAEEEEIDLIVIGTHGRTGVGRFFLGSVTEKVVRHASIPVLTVSPESEDYRDDPSYRKILATFDFSNHSKQAVRKAFDLAAVYDAKLTVLYVIEQDVHPGYYASWRESVDSEIPDIVADARKSLTETLGTADFGEVEIHVRVGKGTGRVFRTIRDFAVDHEMDLIVMGSHGLSGFERVLLGSTTERVIRVAPCPVLAFHLSR
jgi:nucleotide-binding universal stress UspA family protein